MVRSIVTDYVFTEPPADFVDIFFDQVTDVTKSALKGSRSDLAVFYFSFASEDAKKSKEYDFNSLEYFPGTFLSKESPLSLLAKSNKFTAKLSSKLESSSTTESGGLLVECVLGCGKKSSFSLPDAYALAKEVSGVLVKYKVKLAALVLEHFTGSLAEGLLTGTLFGLGLEERFKDTKAERHLEKLYLLHPDLAEDAVKKAKVLASSMHMASELVTAPANYANTVSVSKFLETKLTSLGLTVKILEEKDCLELGMGSYLSVASSSIYPPKFIHATYTGEGPIRKKLAFVGKGIMYDSGGYNIKLNHSLVHLMKFDMAGMAAVFGAAAAVAKLKPKGVEVHFISPTCENMVDASATRPGDIVKASNGKTIEVINTDAEGRLALADALIYATKLGVDYIVDVATLTGACIVSLGEFYAGYFVNDDEYAKLVSKAFEASGELSWRLPLAKEYKEYLESEVADLANLSYGTKCSTILAALFLQEFVKEVPWVHIDIAGPGVDWSSNKGEGYGVRTLVQLVINVSKI